MTKHLSSLWSSVFLLFTVLSTVDGMNIDNALQYRQIVPRGTGPSSSNTPQSSPTSMPLSSAAAPATLSVSTPDSSASSSPSSASSISTSGVSDSTLPSTIGTSSASPSSLPNTFTVSSTTKPQVSTTPASSPSTLESTAKTSTGSPTVSVRSTTWQVVNTVIVTSGGSSYTSVRTTNPVQAVSGPASTSTQPPTVGADSGSNNSSGLEPSQKRIIVGVVVGVGGAMLLGGLAVVVWRVWGKRKSSADEDHELMDSQPGSSSLEKRSSVSSNSPFRSTLDQYHNPAGPVNTASNF